MGEVLRPCVMGDELQAISESFVDLGLKRVVVVGRIITKKGNILSPAILGEVGSPLDLGNTRRETYDRWLIHIHIRIVGVKAVSIVAHKGELHGNSVAQLVLDCEVVSVQPGQAHTVRARPRKNAYRQPQQAVRRDGREHWRCGSGG